jgi:hypothetical protein
MKIIADRGRKILSRLFRVISVSAASLILQACYGVMPPDEPWAAYGMPPPDRPDYIQHTSISGKVVSRETQEPIFGIEVTIEENGKIIEPERTDKNGYFSFYLPIQDVYKLKIEDVDGPYNGGLFKGQTWTLNKNDSYKTLLIGLDVDTSDTQPGTQPGMPGTETGCCKTDSETETDGGEVEAL